MKTHQVLSVRELSSVGRKRGEEDCVKLVRASSARWKQEFVS